MRVFLRVYPSYYGVSKLRERQQRSYDSQIRKSGSELVEVISPKVMASIVAKQMIFGACCLINAYQILAKLNEKYNKETNLF